MLYGSYFLPLSPNVVLLNLFLLNYANWNQNIYFDFLLFKNKLYKGLKL